MAKKQTTHRVYLEPLQDLPGGWYVGHSGGINHYIYGRGPKDRALELSRHDAMYFVQGARDKGYPAKAVPPIEVTF